MTRQSGLVMRERETLTIGRLLENEGSLGRPRLVVLSACETGLYDIERNPDEFVGLPATFMQIGAAGVVGSLWPVDDLATALLMARLYDLHLNAGREPPAALRDAQAWLRQATRAAQLSYVKNAAVKAKLDAGRLTALTDELTGRGSRGGRFGAIRKALHEKTASASQPKGARSMSRHPFQHPYYWAGFVYTGL